MKEARLDETNRGMSPRPEVQVPKNYLLWLWGLIIVVQVFGQVYDHWVLGPLGSPPPPKKKQHFTYQGHCASGPCGVQLGASYHIRSVDLSLEPCELDFL